MRGEAASSDTYSKTSESSGNCIKSYVDHPKYRPRKIVSSMNLGIHQMIVRSWETLVISIPKKGLPRIVGMIPQIKTVLTDRNKIVLLLIIQWMRSSLRRIIK